jgi:hypothetical protein
MRQVATESSSSVVPPIRETVSLLCPSALRCTPTLRSGSVREPSTTPLSNRQYIRLYRPQHGSSRLGFCRHDDNSGSAGTYTRSSSFLVIESIGYTITRGVDKLWAMEDRSGAGAKEVLSLKFFRVKSYGVPP